MTIKHYLFFFIFAFFLSSSFANKGYSIKNNLATTSEKRWNDHVSNIYQSLVGDVTGLSYNTFEKALVGYYNLKNQNKLSGKNLLSIVDFSLPSTEKRLWIINISNRKILYHSLVSHGKNTGLLMAKDFSNIPETHKSSLGFYVTGQTYYGKHDLSLRLTGVDGTFNSNAFDRAIVMHGAKYVSEDWIKKYGYLGRSFGCPAIPLNKSKEVINLLADGTCLFLYHNNKEYQKNSSLLNKTAILESLNGYGDNFLTDYHLK